MASERDTAFEMPKDVTVQELVDFNSRLMAQIWAVLFPSQLQPGQRSVPIGLELNGSSKNYLLVPLKLIEQYSTLAYEIDFETIKSFS